MIYMGPGHAPQNCVSVPGMTVINCVPDPAARIFTLAHSPSPF